MTPTAGSIRVDCMYNCTSAIPPDVAIRLCPRTISGSAPGPPAARSAPRSPSRPGRRICAVSAGRGALGSEDSSMRHARFAAGRPGVGWTAPPSSAPRAHVRAALPGPRAPRAPPASAHGSGASGSDSRPSDSGSRPSDSKRAHSFEYAASRQLRLRS